MAEEVYIEEDPTEEMQETEAECEGCGEDCTCEELKLDAGDTLAEEPVAEKEQPKPKKEKVLRTKYNHAIDSFGGFVDENLEKMTNRELANNWNAANPMRYVARGNVNGHIKHLILEHKVNITTEELGKGDKKFVVS